MAFIYVLPSFFSPVPGKWQCYTISVASPMRTGSCQADRITCQNHWAGKSSKLTKSPQAPRYRRALEDSNPGGLVPLQETLPAELELISTAKAEGALKLLGHMLRPAQQRTTGREMGQSWVDERVQPPARCRPALSLSLRPVLNPESLIYYYSLIYRFAWIFFSFETVVLADSIGVHARRNTPTRRTSFSLSHETHTAPSKQDDQRGKGLPGPPFPFRPRRRKQSSSFDANLILFADRSISPPRSRGKPRVDLILPAKTLTALVSTNQNAPSCPTYKGPGEREDISLRLTTRRWKGSGTSVPPDPRPLGSEGQTPSRVEKGGGVPETLPKLNLACEGEGVRPTPSPDRHPTSPSLLPTEKADLQPCAWEKRPRRKLPRSCRWEGEGHAATKEGRATVGGVRPSRGSLPNQYKPSVLRLLNHSPPRRTPCATRRQLARQMAGSGDHQFRLGATIRFGSLEFLVNEMPDARGGVLRLILVDNPDCPAARAGQVPCGGPAVSSAASEGAATATQAVSVVSRNSIAVSRVGRERILNPSAPDEAFGFVFVTRLQKPNDQEGEASAFPFGLRNASQTFSDSVRRQAWKGLERVHTRVRLLRYEGILRHDQSERAWTGEGSGSAHPPEDCPTRECFTVVPPDDATNGANGAEIRLTPEQIAAKQQELEDMRHAIEIEQAQLDANMEPMARVQAREVGQRIETNADGYPLFDRASQCIAAATLLSRQLPQLSTLEERRVQNGLRTLLERAVVRQAASSAGRRRQSARNSRSPSPVDRKRPADGSRRNAPNTDAAKVQDRLGPDRDVRHTIEARHRDKSEEPEDRVPRIRHRRRVAHIETEEDWDSNSDSDCPGPAAFSHEIRTLAIPPRFRFPTNFSKYVGETDPLVWLDDFRLACRVGGAFDDKVIIRNLPLYLAEPARVWLERLPNGKIRSWADLRSIFIGNFQGTCARPGKVWNLKRCRQKHGETLRDYLRRFSRQYNNLSDATDADAIAALMGGTKSRPLVNRIGRECPKMIKERRERNHGGKKKREETADEAGPSDYREKKKKKKKKERRNQNPPDPKDGCHKGRRPNEGQTPDYFEQLLEGPCPNHATPVKHKYRECGLMRKFPMGRLDGVSPTRQPQGKGTVTDSFPEPNECLMIFGGPEAQASKRRTKLMERDVFTVHPTNQEFLRWSEAAITFDRSDHTKYVPHPRKLPLVVAQIIGRKRVSKVLMDGGSGLNILYASTLDALGVPRSHVRPERAPFYGVVLGKEAVPLGQITLPVTFGDRENFRTETLCFEVVDFDSSYHAILGRPCYAKFMAVPNYVYLKLKMPRPNGVIVVGTSPQVAYKCKKESCTLAAALVASRQLAKAKAAVEASKELVVSQAAVDAMAVLPSTLEGREVRDARDDDGPARKRAMLELEAERQFHPSSDTKKQRRSSSPPPSRRGRKAHSLTASRRTSAYMPGIPWEVAEHSLDIRKGAKPVRQPTRRCNKFKRKIIIEEVAKLLDAWFIREVIDSTVGCEALCFLDVYSGYHQIALKESNQLATSFVTPYGVFCYTMMAFGLKNAGATFQRCMNQCLGDLVRRTVEVYVDDIVVKSKRADNLVQDLEATFDRLWANRVKLNPDKCVFGVSKGLLLGFVVSARGIEANPEKIAAITNMGPLSSVKDVQKLTARLGERGLPLYKLLKRDGSFEWSAEAQQAHQTTYPGAPTRGGTLALVVSAVLVVEREEEGHALKIHHPVYYISEVLTESKTRYLHIQKMIYAILIGKHKLRHYFDAHRVTVVTKHTLGEVINNREATGRIAKWSLVSNQVSAPADLEYSVLHFDGAQNRTGSGVGVVFMSPIGVMMRYAIRLHFPASNNMAEYEALLAGLRIGKELGIHRLEARGDSQLVVDQVNGDAKCHNPKLAVYCEAARRAQEKFKGLGFVHLRQEYNKAADELAKLASWRQPVLPGVFADDQHQPSVNFNDGAPSLGPNPEQLLGPEGSPDQTRVVVAIVSDPDEGPDLEEEQPLEDPPEPERDWRTPFLSRLVDGALPARRTEARRLIRRAMAYRIIEGNLYRRGHNGFLQCCILNEEGRSLLRDIHGGVCGHHAASRILLPIAVADAERILRTCEGCQFYAKKTHLRAQALQTIPITWPFAVWGLDMVGPLPRAPGGFTHMFVAVDKFTKWIEARLLTEITSEQAVRFFRDILCRFGFTGKKFTRFCNNYGIEVAWAAVAHPRTNGQVERASDMILQGLKPRIVNRLVKRIHKLGAKWVEELPSVLWSLQTTPTRGTSFSPFYMVYGSEAILPTDVDYGSPRVQAFDEEANTTNLEDAADELEEAREVAVAHSAKYQQGLRRYHVQRVRGRAFQPNIAVASPIFSPPLEGPYTVVRVLPAATLLPMTSRGGGSGYDPNPPDPTEGGSARTLVGRKAQKAETEVGLGLSAVQEELHNLKAVRPWANHSAVMPRRQRPPPNRWSPISGGTIADRKTFEATTSSCQPQAHGAASTPRRSTEDPTGGAAEALPLASSRPDKVGRDVWRSCVATAYAPAATIAWLPSRTADPANVPKRTQPGVNGRALTAPNRGEGDFTLKDSASQCHLMTELKGLEARGLGRTIGFALPASQPSSRAQGLGGSVEPSAKLKGSGARGLAKLKGSGARQNHRVCLARLTAELKGSEARQNHRVYLARLTGKLKGLEARGLDRTIGFALPTSQPKLKGSEARSVTENYQETKLTPSRRNWKADPTQGLAGV
nr:unnamed protein product [Digitaria exilis]